MFPTCSAVSCRKPKAESNSIITIHFTLFPSLALKQFSNALTRVLGDSAAYTPSNELKRNFGEKRKYVTTRTKTVSPPARPQVRKSIESIRDGSCFPVKKRKAPDETSSCCKRACNSKFSPDSIVRARAKVPDLGREQQTARKVFVQSCIQEDKSLCLNDFVGFSAVVCQLFFVAVTGCSKKLINAAMELGGPGM